MITSEGYEERLRLQSRGDGYSNVIYENGNGGRFQKKNQFTNYKHDKAEGLPAYNVGFGSTSLTAAWVEWSAAQCDKAGISTAGMSDDPNERKTVQINVPQANIYTTMLYGQTTKVGGPQTSYYTDESGNDVTKYFTVGSNFFDLYERQDDRHARHDALRAAGFVPPFPRADRFYKNKHQSSVRPGLSTSPHYLKE